MVVTPDNPLPAAAHSSAVPVSMKCVECDAEERRLLHHTCNRGVFRRLCTTCVLRQYPQSFCPTCFQLYPPAPSADAKLTCIKCYSSSHSQCVAVPSPNPYTCPLCVNPNSPVFNLKPAEEVNVTTSECDECRVMDRDAAKMLMVAARIACMSMNKAAIDAKTVAESRSKEAAFARKRAKEALEHVAQLVVKLRNKQMGTSVNIPRSLGRAGGIGVAEVKRENNANVFNGTGSRNGIASSSNGGPSVILEDPMGNVDRVENSNQVLGALNVVQLRENEIMSGPMENGVEMGVPIDDDHGSVTDMDVGDHVMLENLGEQEDVNTQPVMDELQQQYKENTNGGELHGKGVADS